MKTLRLVWISWLFHIRSLTTSGFFLLISFLQPLIFATIAFYIFKAGQKEGTLLYAALGAGLMGIWSSTLFGSGGAIQWQRWLGTLESLIVAPPPFIFVLAPLTIATSTIGLYSLASTLAWGRILFGIPIDLAHPWLFALAVPATVVSLGFLGLVLAATFILYRHANALSNLLEYPVWLITGLLVPLSLLPGWVNPISWALAPTWGVRAIRDAALGGDALPAIGMCAALAVVYLVIGSVALRYFETLARRQATLALT
jgi:ABC-2 type transport system permease protein